MTEEDGVVDAIKSGAEIKKNKKSRVTRVGEIEDAVKGSKETRFHGVTRQVGGLKLIKV